MEYNESNSRRIVESERRTEINESNENIESDIRIIKHNNRIIVIIKRWKNKIINIFTNYNHSKFYKLSYRQAVKLTSEIAKIENLLESAEKYDNKMYRNKAIEIIEKNKLFHKYKDIKYEDTTKPNIIDTLVYAKSDLNSFCSRQELSNLSNNNMRAIYSIISLLIFPLIIGIFISYFNKVNEIDAHRERQQIEIEALKERQKTELKAFKQRQIYSTDFNRITQIIKQLTDIQIESRRIKREIMNDENNQSMISLSVDSLIDNVQEFENSFLNITQSIPFQKRSKEKLVELTAYFEVSKLLYCLMLNKDKSLKDSYTKVLSDFVDNNIKAKQITSDQGYQLKKNIFLCDKCGACFNHLSFQELTSYATNHLFKQLGTNVFIHDE